MSVRGLIFDLDGTLVDSNPAHVEAWRRAFAEVGDPVPADRIAPLIGMGGDKLVPAAAGEPTERRHGDDLRAAHARHYQQVAAERPPRVFAGAVELVRDGRRMGVKTALATSSSREHLTVTATACGHDFAADVDVLVTADDADGSKPDPDSMHAAARRLGLDPSECVLVGDTPHDGQAATAAGIEFWGVQTGGFAASDLWASGADRVFPDVAAVWRHLDDLLSPATCVQPAMRQVG
jgi:HAD superfamily hydrolase (TIGR01509 family)